MLPKTVRVPDDLYYNVRPMLAVSGGRMIALSTPFGRRGWFHREWTEGAGWERHQIDAPQSLDFGGDASLITDATGVGAPVVDLFVGAGLDPVGVFIHGGDRVTHEGRSWRVPKRDLVCCLQVLLQSGQIKIASKLELGPVLSACREQDHDDLVLSVALAAMIEKPVQVDVPAADGHALLAGDK